MDRCSRSRRATIQKKRVVLKMRQGQWRSACGLGLVESFLRHISAQTRCQSQVITHCKLQPTALTERYETMWMACRARRWRLRMKIKFEAPVKLGVVRPLAPGTSTSTLIARLLPARASPPAFCLAHPHRNRSAVSYQDNNGNGSR